ncbi:hypothetical protein J4E90_007259 [Alternaria incomplexa]|uniref:uncharacterized protein n=1 Tax=Alternaria incomplexa TaxID=1187928 RepID=UPI00221EF4DA|nr:uncharacterized protein J4E90_007259 [Alternaria incomplexa]KAI4911002.1 hypothetical protein J4E90_007259 [Alternaria incomplexa]
MSDHKRQRSNESGLFRPRSTRRAKSLDSSSLHWSRHDATTSQAHRRQLRRLAQSPDNPLLYLTTMTPFPLLDTRSSYRVCSLGMPRLPVHTTRHQGFREWLAGGLMLEVHQILRKASVRYYDVEVVIRKPFKTPGPDSEYHKTVIALADISVADDHANWAIAARTILERLIALGRDDINVETTDVEAAWSFNNSVVFDDETA